MNLVLRSATDPASLTSAVRAAVAEIDKDQPVFGITPMKELVDDSLSTRRVTLILLGLFSALALILASIGIYMAILRPWAPSASRCRVARPTPCGFRSHACAARCCRTSPRMMSFLLYSIEATDPLTFACVAFLLSAVAFLACYIPARRATRVDPMVALRYE
jgi:putative ABC transport system permease protein